MWLRIDNALDTKHAIEYRLLASRFVASEKCETISHHTYTRRSAFVSDCTTVHLCDAMLAQHDNVDVSVYVNTLIIITVHVFHVVALLSTFVRLV